MSGSRPLDLVVCCGTATPSRLPLSGRDQVTLGRAEDSDVRVEGSRVSSRHAVLQYGDGGWTLLDLGSSAGTRVNGRFVKQARLAPGDVVGLGGVEFKVEEPDTGAQAERVGNGPSRELLEALAALLTAEDEPVERLLEAALDRLLEAFGADRAAVYLPRGEAFERLCLRVAPRALVDPEEPVSERFVARVASGTGAHLLSSADTEELRASFRSVAGQLRSMLAAPLPLPGRSGVLYLDSAYDRRAFGDRDPPLLLAFAKAAGLALARDREVRDGRAREERTTELRRRDLAGAELVGRSPAMRAVGEEIVQAAGADVTVLVTGESGTGKELVARALHRASSRADEAFVAVNCAAIPAELVESELFGHEKGAFTGAEARRLGRFELASGGTLFLDEIGELPLPVQGKLLRALEERAIQRIGGSRPIPVDFRLVSATHVDLTRAVKEGRFREDLFYRIAVFRMRLPALRERGEDVVELARHFLSDCAARFRRTLTGLDEAAVTALSRHDWPGNVRELRNAIEQAVVRETGTVLSARALLPALGADAGMHLAPAVRSREVAEAMKAFPVGYEEAKRTWEKQFLLHQITAFGGNMSATATALGMSRRNLYTRCDELGIDYQGLRGA